MAQAKGKTTSKTKPATPKFTYKPMTEGEFDGMLKTVSSQAEEFSLALHQAGLYCIYQANHHNNAGYAQRLIEAIGKKQDIRRLGFWMQTFGKIGVRKGLLVFKKRKDITPANADAWIQRANEKPYWELTPQPKLVVTYDYLSMLNAIISKAANVANLEEEGKTVTEKNTNILEDIKKIILANTPKEDQEEVKAKAQTASDRIKHYQEMHA